LSILLILGGVLVQGERSINARAQRPIPTVEWYLMLHELENPAHQFQIDKNNKIFATTGAAKSKEYFTFRYVAKRHDLRLVASKGGFMVLMTNVKGFSIDQQHHLTVTTCRNQTFKSQLLLPEVPKA